MIFKTWITDLTKLQSFVNNIKNIEAWENITAGLLTKAFYNSYDVALLYKWG